MITINRRNQLKNASFLDFEVDRESLECSEHFGTKFEIFRAKKSCKSAFRNKQFAGVFDPEE